MPLLRLWADDGAQEHRLEPAPTPPQSWRVVVVTKLVPVQIIRRSSRPGQGDLTVVYDRFQVVISYSCECKPYGHLGTRLAREPTSSAARRMGE